MDFRKLIEFGKGSYVVSLPKNWVVENKLRKGSTLSLQLQGSSVLISTSLSGEEREVKIRTISSKNKDIDLISTKIVSAYIQGYNLIEVMTNNDNEMNEKTKEIIMNLAGLELLEQTNTKITAKFLLNLKELSLEHMIRRIDNITRSMILDAFDCAKGECNYESINKRDRDVNRLHFLMQRCVKEGLDNPRNIFGKSAWELHKFYILADKIEKVADRQKRIARCLEELKLSKVMAQELLKVYTMLNDLYTKVMTAYYKTDITAALEIELGSNEMYNQCNGLIQMDLKLSKKPGKTKSKEHEYTLFAEIVNNFKAMGTSIKLLARLIRDNQ